MKRVLILLLLILDIVIMILYFNINSSYLDVKNIYISKLNSNSYDELVLELDSQYNNIINKIKDTSGYKIDDSFNYDMIVKKLDGEYDNLIVINNDLSKKKDSLNKQKDAVMKTYNKIMEEHVKKNTYVIDGVAKINQYSQGYPTGCESAALTILLKYYGVNVSMSDVVNKLAKGKLPYYENGVKYGGNPYIEFIGDPSDYNSYGVFEKPILQVAESFKSGIIDGSGKNLDEVLEIVSEGRPVMVWASMNMALPYVSTSWIYKPTGEKISWLSNEHALVIVGYNQNSVIVTDSLTGSIRYFDRNVFKSRYNTYGKRAVYY